MTKKDVTSLFNNRVENYMKYRPSYPPAVIDLLNTHCQLSANSRIADIGSGTGLLTELFLKNGNPVFAVEPNDEMRQAAEKLLSAYPNFTSAAGRAEATTLPPHSVDFVTAGQSFHWFDRPLAYSEFQRILTPEGWVVLAWNTPRKDTPFLKEYTYFRRTMLKGAGGSRKDDPGDVLSFFLPGHARQVVLPGIHQDLDFEQLLGRICSISISIQPGEPGFDAFTGEVRALFERHQQGNRVRLSYDTEVFIGQLNP